MILIATKKDQVAYATELFLSFGKKADKVILEMLRVIPESIQTKELRRDLIEVMMIIDELKVRHDIYK